VPFDVSRISAETLTFVKSFTARAEGEGHFWKTAKAGTGNRKRNGGGKMGKIGRACEDGKNDGLTQRRKGGKRGRRDSGIGVRDSENCHYGRAGRLLNLELETWNLVFGVLAPLREPAVASFPCRNALAKAGFVRYTSAWHRTTL
jgi:hypothetical protein